MVTRKPVRQLVAECRFCELVIKPATIRDFSVRMPAFNLNMLCERVEWLGGSVKCSCQM